MCAFRSVGAWEIAIERSHSGTGVISVARVKKYANLARTLSSSVKRYKPRGGTGVW